MRLISSVGRAPRFAILARIENHVVYKTQIGEVASSNLAWDFFCFCLDSVTSLQNYHYVITY